MPYLANSCGPSFGLPPDSLSLMPIATPPFPLPAARIAPT